MPEKQERLHQFNPTESVVMTSGQQAQKMVEEAKKRFWLNPEEENLIVTYAQKYDDPSLASHLIQKLEQAVYNADPVAVTTMQQIEEIPPFIQDDTELVRVVTGTIEKMKRMPDAQFAQLDLEPYRKEDGDE